MDMRRTVVLSASAALAVLLLGVAALLWTQQAQAQEPCSIPFCIDKTADQDTVEVGQQITFTITQRCPSPFPNVTCGTPRDIVDVLPSGLSIDSVDANEPTNPDYQCSTNGNTVTCPGFRNITSVQPFTATIVATTTECGTFTNTASDGVGTGQATFTVVHCVPMTKEECKKGGWKDFGIYPDQGTCISAWNNQNRP